VRIAYISISGPFKLMNGQYISNKLDMHLKI